MHSRGGATLVLQNGDSGEFAHFVRSAEGKWNQFADVVAAILKTAPEEL